MAEPKLFELNNGTMQVKVSNFGCTITSLFVPDKDGKLADVVLGFDTLEPYLKGAAPYFGCIVGRVANRIKDGKFSLNGVEYALPINKPPNSLHGFVMNLISADGGHKGFDKVIWEVANISRAIIHQSRSNIIVMMEKKIFANHLTPVDHNTVPTGEIMPVKGTPFDFTTENKIGSRIHEVGLGYDHNYVLDCGDENSGLKHAAKLKDPNSLRTLNLWTNAPGMQFYTANYVNGIVGKGGAVYGKHAAACLETQGYPNAINQPNFPSVVVQPGETYKHCMLFEFSAE
ncbi:hypothetical protein DH2020_042564 [Rehmannia glutinosa]|uniref:Aldose 1-epimerase n=1 Tax=Rehmannia glutinosa TaxID=99300 RepID=A0ABR0UN35_REHGL